MFSLRVGASHTSTFVRGATLKRAGHHLARRDCAPGATPIKRSKFVLYAGLTGAGVGLHAYTGFNNIYCDSTSSRLFFLSAYIDALPESISQQAPPVATPPPTQPGPGLPTPPTSSLSLLELTFGSVCGICAGVFIKKGAKFVAFILGGTFVLLQVMPVSQSRAFSLTSGLSTISTSDQFPSSELTGPAPQLGLRTCSTGQRTVSDALQHLDLFGVGS